MNEQAITQDKTTSIVVPAYPTLAKMENLLENILPSEMCAKRLIRLFYVELARNPNLNKCTIESVCGAIMSCAQHGLEPGIAGMVYLIPRGNKMSLMIGYRGMLELSYRSGHISTIESYCVYKNDNFQLTMGTNSGVIHSRDLDVIPGPMIGVYAVITMKDGTKQFNCMSKNEVEAVRKRSASANSGPWITDYEEMAKKTVIRRMLKICPTSVSVNSAISLDEASEYDNNHLEAVGKAAIAEMNASDNVIDITESKSQSDVLADKLGG